MRADTPPQLKRSIRLIDLVMLGAGAAMGASIFSVFGPAAAIAGSGVVVAVLLAALPMVLFGLVYGFMASVMPRSGASYEWQRAFVHPMLGFMISWLRLMGSAMLIVMFARVLVNYLKMALPLPDRPMMLAAIAGVFALNYFGVGLAARAQTVLMVLMLAVLAVFAVVGAPQAELAKIGDVMGGGWLPILAALPLMIHLFLGIETATEVGEEAANAQRNIPLALVLALALSAGVYLVILLISLGLVGPAALAASKAPMVTAAEAALGPFAKPLVIGAAVLALLKSMNAIFLVYTRSLFAMGRAGVLPAALGRLHPRWGTPHIAVCTAFAATCIGALAPSSLVFLFIAINIPTMMKYFGTCLAALNLVRRRPDLHALSRLPMGRRTVGVLSILGMACALLIIVAGFKTDPRAYLVLGGWAVAGLAVWLLGRKQTPGPTPAPLPIDAGPVRS